MVDCESPKEVGCKVFLYVRAKDFQSKPRKRNRDIQEGFAKN